MKTMKAAVAVWVALCVLGGRGGRCQEQGQAAGGVQVGSRDAFNIPGYEEVTTQGLGGFGALERCGEGSDAGVHTCVPYYRCDGRTNTIIPQETAESEAAINGYGVIDIRFGANSCEHPLDVCCLIPEGGVPPSSERPPATPAPPPGPGQEADHCGVRHPNGIDFKITGARDHEAEYGEFPWMVAVLRRFYDPHQDGALAVCGGSLIAPGVVLTGAHCVHKYKPDELKIRAGEWDTQTEKERLPYQERGVQEIIIHDQFNANTLFHDVALVILKKPFSKADNVGTICLPQQNQVINSQHCYASGWGKDKFGKEGQFQVILKKIELPIVPWDACQYALRTTRLGKPFELHKSFTCAGGVLGKDTCTGDGGSPLVCPDAKRSGRYVQAGIVAWGIGCGEENIPGVYADVTQFREWVDYHMERLNIDTRPYYV